MTETSPTPDRKRDARIIGYTAAAVAFVWFALANTGRVPITFWVFTRREPMIIVIVIAGALGAAIGYLVARRHRGGPKD